jgi:hypothetical protein
MRRLGSWRTIDPQTIVCAYTHTCELPDRDSFINLMSVEWLSGMTLVRDNQRAGLHGARGRAVQVDRIEPMLKAPKTKRLKL